MRTKFSAALRARPDAQEVEAELHKCVHCGFCNVTCPTYRLRQDERDGPRGRLYLVKEALETGIADAALQTHLDRCLSCRACESTCPAGVQYGRVLDAGRAVAEGMRRPLRQRLNRWLIRALVPYPRRFAALLLLGRIAGPLAPARLRRLIPQRRPPGPERAEQLPRRMLLLQGCVQGALDPVTNAAARRVLARFGIGLQAVPAVGCCGAVEWHLTALEAARARMRRNIDAWWPQIEAGAEAIVIAASGCAVTVKDYGHALREDPAYAHKAARVSALARDLAQVVAAEDLNLLPRSGLVTRRIAFHAPCSLQHGEGLGGVVEGVLRALGFELLPVADPEQCCGAAGSYVLLEPARSQQILARKLETLQRGQPELIATANIGCQVQLQSRTTAPVRHWIELLDARLDPVRTAGGAQAPGP